MIIKPNLTLLTITMLFLFLTQTKADSIAVNNKPLKAVYLGKQTEPLPKVDNKSVAIGTAVVTFQKSDKSKFAFDEYQEYYSTVSIIKNGNIYEHLNAGSRYDVPWKLLPEGESDVVEAKIDIKNTDFDPEKVIFSTPKGTNYNYAYDKSKKTYTLTVSAGTDGDVQEIYALNRINSQNYETLGKLNVITYKKQTPKVKVVFVNNNKVDTGKLKTELDKIYRPYGVDWQVSADEFTCTLGSAAFLDEASGLLQSYTEPMTALQNAYAQAKGIDKNACYIFVLNYSGVSNNRNTAGFMPRGKQFGYIFLDNISKGGEYNVIAHELGHGLWKLRHTFDGTYGNTAKGTEGATANLMDYSNGNHLAKWQWDIMRSPAIFDGVFDSDDEAMTIMVDGITLKEEGYFIRPDYRTIIKLPANSKVLYSCSRIVNLEIKSCYLYKFKTGSNIWEWDDNKKGYYCNGKKYADEGNNLKNGDIVFLTYHNFEDHSLVIQKYRISSIEENSIFTIYDVEANGLLGAAIKAYITVYCYEDGKHLELLLNNLKILNAERRSNQAVELDSWDNFTNNFKRYRLNGNQLEEIDVPLSDNDIQNGNWTDKSIETRIRYTVNENGIIQIKAFGFQKDLQVFKHADLPALARNIKEQTNKYLLENNVVNFDSKPKSVETTDIFADGGKISIGGNNAKFIKIISEGMGVTTTLLKTGEIEENVYLKNRENTVAIHAPGVVTGGVEVVAQKVTDLTSLATLVYDLAVNKEARAQTYNQFKEIKNEIGADPKNFIPIFVDVIVSVTTGNSAEEWKITVESNADSGKRSHLVTRGTGNAVITVIAGAAIVKDLPEIAEKLAENIKKVKNLSNVVEDLSTFVAKSLPEKLEDIKNIWKTKYPLPDMFEGRTFFEDVMGEYRYIKADGWAHTVDIAPNFKGVDFYKGTTQGNQIFAETAVSMKTTITTDVNAWLNSKAIQDNLRFLQEGFTTEGLKSSNKIMFFENAEIHIYMPKENVTDALKTEWLNKLNTVNPKIKFEINVLDNYIR